MADDPSNAELGRRLDTIQGLLQGLVGRFEYDADKRALDYRFSELKADLIAAERQVAELRKLVEQRTTELQAALDKHVEESAKSSDNGRRHWQTLIYTGVIPSVVAVIAILVSKGTL